MIKIYTDGSSLGNPGPGGYAAVIIHKNKEKIVKGGEADSTNNRMEIQAAIKALEWVEENFSKKKITLYSDSSLLVKTVNEGWKRKSNLDLWTNLDAVLGKVDVDFVWVKGHAGNKYNEICDNLAVLEAQKHKGAKKRKQDSKSDLYHCSRCKKSNEGDLGLMPDSKMIRVDCLSCGSFIKFAPQTSENITKSRGKILISKDLLNKVINQKKEEGMKISDKDIAKFKTWTTKEAQIYLNSRQKLL